MRTRFEVQWGLLLLACVVLAAPGRAQPTNVNLGATANDGTGDPLRTAFTKLNANQQWLWNLYQNLLTYGGTNNAGVAGTNGALFYGLGQGFRIDDPGTNLYLGALFRPLGLDTYPVYSLSYPYGLIYGDPVNPSVNSILGNMVFRAGTNNAFTFLDQSGNVLMAITNVPAAGGSPKLVADGYGLTNLNAMLLPILSGAGIALGTNSTGLTISATGGGSAGNVAAVADGITFTGLTATQSLSGLSWTNNNSLYPAPAACSFTADGEWKYQAYGADTGFQFAMSSIWGFASQFRANSTYTMCSVQMPLYKIGSPAGSLYVSIMSDNPAATNPAAVLAVSSPVADAAVPIGAGAFAQVSFPISCSIVSNTLYWLCITNTVMNDTSDNIQPAFYSVNGTTPAQDSLRWNGSAWIHQNENQRMSFISFQ